MINLKRCPFCGGEASLEAIRENEIAFYYVECDQCNIGTYSSTNMKEVVDMWNTRTPEIVRCGECEHYERADDLCTFDGVLTCPDWFCRYGERSGENASTD